MLTIDREIRLISPKEMRTSSCISHFRSARFDCMEYTLQRKQSCKGEQSCDDKREGDPRTADSRNELLRGLTGRVPRYGSEGQQNGLLLGCYRHLAQWHLWLCLSVPGLFLVLWGMFSANEKFTIFSVISVCCVEMKLCLLDNSFSLKQLTHEHGIQFSSGCF